MRPNDSERIATYYDRLVDQYGHDPRACDASSQESLNVRYRVLSDILDLSGKSVLEVGCGFGDLGAYLLNRYERLRYTGIDVSRRMIEEAARLHPGMEFRNADLLDYQPAETFDVVLAQGIFYLLGDGAEATMQQMVTRMFALARLAVGFTAISNWAPIRSPEEFYVDPLRLVELGRQLTTYLVLRHDYHPGDTAIYLYKGRNEP